MNGKHLDGNVLFFLRKKEASVKQEQINLKYR